MPIGQAHEYPFGFKRQRCEHPPLFLPHLKTQKYRFYSKILDDLILKLNMYLIFTKININKFL